MCPFFLFSGSTYREETEEQSSLNPEPKKSSKSGKKKKDKSKRRVSSRKEEKNDWYCWITTKPGSLYHEYFSCAKFTCTELQKVQ